MTLLPEVERALIAGASRHYDRRRRAARAGAKAAPLLAVAATAAAVALVVAPSSDVEREAASQRPLPAGDVAALAAAAGCELAHPPIEGNQHAARAFRPIDYATNPPTSGDHTPDFADDGVHEPGATPPLGALVHSLEHGRIHFQYRPGSSDATIEALRALVEDDPHHVLLTRNETEMPALVAATAWGHSLTCADSAPASITALNAFRDRYVDKGPELVP